MAVFLPTLNQMGFLLLVILIGYIVSRCRIIPNGGVTLLSKLENNVFIPAFMLNTFIRNFTVNRLSTAWQYFLCGTGVAVIGIPVAMGLARMCTKDLYTRNIYSYGLAFSNFAFMGNAVVAAVFPDVLVDYLIFVLPFWALIYMWGAPVWLVPPEGDGKSIKDRLRTLLNPMFISLFVGMGLGLLNFQMPDFLDNTISSLGACMSPLAMLLTGMTIAQYDLKALFKNVPIYVISVLRLLVIPAIAIVILIFVPLPYGLSLCTVCAIAMPVGLNTIIIPSAYGKDTSLAAGMALISHLLSLLTIPLVFMLFELIV